MSDKVVTSVLSGQLVNLWCGAAHSVSLGWMVGLLGFVRRYITCGEASRLPFCLALEPGEWTAPPVPKAPVGSRCA